MFSSAGNVSVRRGRAWRPGKNGCRVRAETGHCRQTASLAESVERVVMRRPRWRIASLRIHEASNWRIIAISDARPRAASDESASRKKTAFDIQNIYPCAFANIYPRVFASAGMNRRRKRAGVCRGCYEEYKTVLLFYKYLCDLLIRFCAIIFIKSSVDGFFCPRLSLKELAAKWVFEKINPYGAAPGAHVASALIQSSKCPSSTRNAVGRGTACA